MAGLLSPFQDPANAGLLGLSAGLLQASGPQRFPTSLGQAVGSGLLQGVQMQEAARKANLSADLINAQTHHFTTQDKLTQTKIDQAAQQAELQKQLLQRFGFLPQAGATQQAGVSSLPGIAAGQEITQQPSSAASSSRGFSITPNELAALKIAGFDLTGVANYAKGQVVRPGGGVVIQGPNGPELAFQLPRLGEGMTIGPKGEVAVAPKYAEAATAISGIPNLSGKMFTIPVSNQRQLSLTQPEFVQYVKSGGTVLPQRYKALSGELPGMNFSGNAPTQQAPAPAGAQHPPGISQDTGVVGATQSQAEQVQQNRQQAGGSALDQAFAKEYASWTLGAGADAARQIAQLKDVVTRLGNKSLNLTGPIIGKTPDAILNVVNPMAVSTKERVEEVVQRSLRAILGAQFTENEGKRLIARAYNPNQPESENKIRVKRLYTQLKEAFDAKQNAIKFFDQHGTLAGWQGKLYSINDFNPEGEAHPSVVPGASPSESGPPQGVTATEWAHMTPQEKALWQK